MPFKYAVLWELSDPSQPVGIVVQRGGYVLLELPNGYGMPKRYEAPYEVLQPDMTRVIYRPNDEIYFDQVLHDLSRHFAVCHQGVIEHADDGAILGLLQEHVLAPRTQRQKSDYHVGMFGGRKADHPFKLVRDGQVSPPAYTRRQAGSKQGTASNPAPAIAA